MLSGIRILDLSDERGFLAGKILGDLGADVIKVEPPGGDREGRRGPELPIENPRISPCDQGLVQALRMALESNDLTSREREQVENGRSASQ